MTPNRKRDPARVVAVKHKTTTVPEGVVEPGDAYVTVAQWQWRSLLNRKYFVVYNEGNRGGNIWSKSDRHYATATATAPLSKDYYP